jgi:hypothetical protein
MLPELRRARGSVGLLRNPSEPSRCPGESRAVRSGPRRPSRPRERRLQCRLRPTVEAHAVLGAGARGRPDDDDGPTSERWGRAACTVNSSQHCHFLVHAGHVVTPFTLLAYAHIWPSPTPSHGGLSGRRRTDRAEHARRRPGQRPPGHDQQCREEAERALELADRPARFDALREWLRMQLGRRGQQPVQPATIVAASAIR